jgi:predicted nucleic acid-binding protein
MTFLDSSVMIDVLTRDPRWNKWSATAIARAGRNLVINHVVLAEISSRFSSAEAAREAVGELGVTILPMTDAAAFLSGRAFHEYRRRGGDRSTILADFLIAGHASALGVPLVTRDKRRLSSYFPELNLITPETDNG